MQAGDGRRHVEFRVNWTSQQVPDLALQDRKLLRNPEQGWDGFRLALHKAPSGVTEKGMARVEQEAGDQPGLKRGGPCARMERRGQILEALSGESLQEIRCLDMQ